jgi:hypothetical protein
MGSISAQDALDWLSVICCSLRILWKELPLDMEIVNVIPHPPGPNFTMRGTCPHCRKGSGFLPRGAGYIGHTNSPTSAIRWFGILECQTCTKFILGIATQPHGNNQNYLVYETHYPLGEPDETVAEEIPEHIKEDFKEALRCLWVKAYNATAEMCRRAMEATCLDLGAPPDKVLEKMIDWLEVNRKITPYLKDAAHKVRLGGNRGAHPPATPLASVPIPASPVIAPAVPAAPTPTAATAPVEKIEKEHAEAIVEFCREFFHHVYVGPKLVGKYDFTKPKAVNLPATPPTN